MSLDVFLELPEPIKKPKSSGIFVRVNGQTVQITNKEWVLQHDGANPIPRPITIETEAETEDETTIAFSGNITHNLSPMAKEAKLYLPLWHPEDLGITHAKELMYPIFIGLCKLKEDPKRFKKFNPENGWGNYEVLVEFTENYLESCCKYPNAKVWVSR